jgi:SAM-dependent methyltransferase
MFNRTAKYYDRIYSFKDYAVESARITEVIRRENPGARSVLDVACGTAEHARLLSMDFAVDGIDLEPEFIGIAQRKLPGAKFQVADMRHFELSRKYDVVQCLFSSIGYLTDPAGMVSALRCFRNHLAPGGVVLVEPWFTPDVWQTGVPHMAPPVDLPELKICRLNVSERTGNLSSFRLHYLIAEPMGVQYLWEDHALMLYTVDEMLGFFAEAGLDGSHDPQGLSGRGLYIARPSKPTLRRE